MDKNRPADARREAALVRMMEQYGGMLVGLCGALLRDRDLAQDVVQETFLRAYQKMDGLRGVYALSERAWLVRIAVNLCRDQQRTKWFRFVNRSVPLDALPEQAEDSVSQSILLEVQQLPLKYREVILLHYYQDMPVGEIAQALRVTPSSVYRRLEKARVMLRLTLEGEDLNA